MDKNLPVSSIHHTPITAHQPVLKVMGLGGGGCNAINRMIELGIKGVEFIAANTDHQALKNSQADTKIHLGPRCTKGLGAGGNPEIGTAAAKESSREIAEALNGADMVFLTAGMGGGTGTGSIPIAAQVARALGTVTVAIVTTPFSFEMGKRQRNASAGLAQLRQHTDTLITVPNDKLLYVAPKDLPMETAFRLADDVLRQGIQGIAEIITQPGLINVDFAHIRRLMQMGGGSMMSIGQGQGYGKAREAIDQALHHPLLDTVSLDSAAGIIANFTGGHDLTFFEVTDALTYLQSQTGGQAEIIPGVIYDDSMGDRVQAILIITGLGGTAIDQVFIHTDKSAQTPQPATRANTPQISPATVESLFQPSPTATRSVEVSFDFPQSSEAEPNQSVNYDLPAFMRRRNHVTGQPD
jgi:cell division protein FtsZ